MVRAIALVATTITCYLSFAVLKAINQMKKRLTSPN